MQMIIGSSKGRRSYFNVSLQHGVLSIIAIRISRKFRRHAAEKQQKDRRKKKDFLSKFVFQQNSVTDNQKKVLMMRRLCQECKYCGINNTNGSSSLRNPIPQRLIHPIKLNGEERQKRHLFMSFWCCSSNYVFVLAVHLSNLLWFRANILLRQQIRHHFPLHAHSSIHPVRFWVSFYECKQTVLKLVVFVSSALVL